MLENHSEFDSAYLRFIMIIIVCIVIGVITRSIVKKKIIITDKRDNVIRTVLFIIPFLIAITLASTTSIPIAFLQSVIIPTIGVSGGWMLNQSVDERKQRKK